MNQEWKRQKGLLLRSLKYFGVAMGISLLFFLVNIPSIPKDKILSEFLWTMSISTFIGFLIVSFFTIFRLSLALIKLKTGRDYKPHNIIMTFISMSGVTIGLYIGFSFKSKVQSAHADFSWLGSAILGSLFVSISISLYRLYREGQFKLQNLKAETVQAQYMALKNQMQPHFLFNSLNSLTELIESNKDSASSMSQKLADLYREILENSKQTTTSLASEASIAKKYLELESLRFGERLRFNIQTPENSDQIFIPSLVLQTLVENSIKHGIAKAMAGGDISVDVIKQQDARYLVSVVNSGEKLKHRSNAGTGIVNTISRLDLLYGKEHSFKMDSDTHGRTVVSFFINGDRVV